MKIENWCGYDIRFIEQGDQWYAVLKDICDALNLNASKVAQRLDPNTLIKVQIDTSDLPIRDPRSHARKTQEMLAVDELGIYEALFSSRRPEAQKFKMWSVSVLQKLRKRVGLEGFEVMRMTDPHIQEEIDHILDRIFWDEEKKCLMESVTVAGGDVEQIPFEEG